MVLFPEGEVVPRTKTDFVRFFATGMCKFICLLKGSLARE